MEKKKVGFASGIGFILAAAGSAVGLGNLWGFPYKTSQNGGAAFVLIYIACVLLIGFVTMLSEIYLGRRSQANPMTAYKMVNKNLGWCGLVAIMIPAFIICYYSVLGGWTTKYALNSFSGNAGIVSTFSVNTGEVILYTALFLVLSVTIIMGGVKDGIEKASKVLMPVLFCILVAIAVYALTLGSGVREGLAFYLLPDWNRAAEMGIGNVIVAAMNQAFFTLSLGVGAMEIFGSYMSRDYTLAGESLRICALDTCVAICSGLIIFPACFSYGVSPDAGPKLIFITLPNVFANMTGGRLWGTLFFVFMTFASFSTIIAVFQNILACLQESFGWSLKRACAVGTVFILLASVPCILGFNLWSGVQPMGPGSTVLDAEDFLVSNLLLPIGSLIYLLFCVTRWGWGFDNYLTEANTGKGLRLPRWFKPYFSVVLPLLIVFILVQGL